MTARFDALVALREKLNERVEVFTEGVSYGSSWICIPAEGADGFDVTLMDDGDEWTVAYGNSWVHDHMSDGEAALDRVALLATDEGRLVETWRGSTLQKARVEALVDGEWQEIWRVGLLFWPFWRRATITIRQNARKMRH